MKFAGPFPVLDWKSRVVRRVLSRFSFQLGSRSPSIKGGKVPMRRDASSCLRYRDAFQFATSFFFFSFSLSLSLSALKRM